MPDREKVIKGLEHCSEDGCKDCPYETDCIMADGFSELAKDALAILREPVEVEHKRNDDEYQAIDDEFTCRNCGAWWMIPRDDLRYCPGCGKAVKWDD